MAESEASGAMMTNFAKFSAFGQPESLTIKERAGRERAASRTPGERARAAKVELELVNFKCSPSEHLLLKETAQQLGMSKTDVIKAGIAYMVAKVKGGQ
jgi:hypothetical protein